MVEEIMVVCLIYDKWETFLLGNFFAKSAWVISLSIILLKVKKLRNSEIFTENAFIGVLKRPSMVLSRVGCQIGHNRKPK